MRILYHNAFVHTFDGDKVYSSMGVSGGKIDYLGNDIPSGYKLYDMKGAHIAPRLFDSHLHLLYTIVLSGQSFFISHVRDSGVTPDNPEDALESIRRYAEENPKLKIIVANGFISSVFKTPRLLTRTELDKAAPGKAVIVYTIDGHSSSLSTRMIELLGMDVKDYPDGIMRGETHEFMQGRVTNLIASSVSLSILAKGIAEFVNKTVEYGIAGVAALDGNEDVENDILTKVLAMIISCLPLDTILYPQYQNFDKAKSLFKRQRRKRIGGCSAWELDGAVNSKSAAFYSPYKDSSDSGHTYYEKEYIESQVRKAAEQDILLSAHAIGPAAIDMLLSAYEDVKDKLDRCDGMYRVDHAEFPSRAAIEKLSSLPLAVTIQPGFSYIDKRYLHSYEKFLTDQQLSSLLPLKRAKDMGTIFLGSSDSPVQEIDPYLQMKGMTDYYIKDESLSFRDAYETYSVNAGLAQGLDYSLKVGNEATFNVYKRDPEKVELTRDDLISSYRNGKERKKIKHPILFLLSLPFRPKRRL